MEKPVVATDVSDVPLVLEGCGFVGKMGQPATIAEGICKMQALSPAERHALGKKGRAKVIENFELNKATTIFWNAHKDVLKMAKR
jgi:glycosyltransferase involved in cell wall biosynthesis